MNTGHPVVVDDPVAHHQDVLQWTVLFVLPLSSLVLLLRHYQLLLLATAYAWIGRVSTTRRGRAETSRIPVPRSRWKSAWSRSAVGVARRRGNAPRQSDLGVSPIAGA